MEIRECLYLEVLFPPLLLPSSSSSLLPRMELTSNRPLAGEEEDDVLGEEAEAEG